jgi:hypothetical protein
MYCKPTVKRNRGLPRKRFLDESSWNKLHNPNIQLVQEEEEEEYLLQHLL